MYEYIYLLYVPCLASILLFWANGEYLSGFINIDGVWQFNHKFDSRAFFSVLIIWFSKRDSIKKVFRGVSAFQNLVIGITAPATRSFSARYISLSFTRRENYKGAQGIPGHMLRGGSGCVQACGHERPPSRHHSTAICISGQSLPESSR